MSEIRTNTQNGTSEDTKEELSAILAQLSEDNIRFLVARQEHSTDTDAARAIGMSRNTVSHWPAEIRELIHRANRLLAEDGIVVARHVRKRNLAKAMLIKVKGLDSADERVRQGVATEVIEWEFGKAAQKQDIGLSGNIGLEITEVIVKRETGNDPAPSNPGGVRG